MLGLEEETDVQHQLGCPLPFPEGVTRHRGPRAVGGVGRHVVCEEAGDGHPSSEGRAARAPHPGSGCDSVPGVLVTPQQGVVVTLTLQIGLQLREGQ